MLDNYLENVTVLGAAGKMGSGILMLTAMEMTALSMKPENKSKQFVINAVDISQQALSGLLRYLQAEIRKAAEKNTVLLRKFYEHRDDLIENYDIIDQYVFDVMSIIRPTTNLEPAYESNLIFEAIAENPELKVKLLSQINENNKKQPWFFTNTSSIPINELDKKAGLGGRILGFHFYNPPVVQKLVELITAETTKSELVDFAHEYAKNLRKKIVPANDFAGFIGNGHFMRDALHGISEVEHLSNEIPFVDALYMVNKVSQEFLIRPMGIFQLIDYVGIDVCKYIMSVMNPYLPDEDIHSDLLDKMLSLGVKGGQNPDGSQKDGFLKYEKGGPSGVYNPDKKDYVSISEFKARCDEKLGALPHSAMDWKVVIADPKKSEIIEKFFNELKSMETLGAELAKRYNARSKEIGLKLVADKVANTEEDVNTVLLTGFYHVYGPINNYLN